MTVRISNLEIPVLTKRATVILFEVKTCNALVWMLLACNKYVSKITSKIHIFNFGYEISGNASLDEQGCEDPWLFFGTKRAPRRRKCGQYCTTLPVSRWKRSDKERKERKKRGKRRAIAIGRTPKRGDKWTREKGRTEINVKLGWRRGIKWAKVAGPYVPEYDQVAGFLRFSINTWAFYCDLTFVLAFETDCYDESLFHLQTVTNEENSRWIFNSLLSNAIFHWHNPSGRTTALGLTQPLTEMSTRIISWRVKAAGA